MRNMERPRTLGSPRPDPRPAPPDLYAIRRREAIYRWAASYCTDNGYRRVLDLGCGDGHGSAVLAARGLEVTSIDGDVAEARRTWRFGRLEFWDAELDRTGLVKHGLDAAVCVGHLERFGDPRPLLAEMRRVVRPGGVAIFGTANRLVASPGRTRPIASDHVWEYTAEELYRLVSWRFPGARIFSVSHGRRLRMVGSATGTSLPVELARIRPPDRTLWLRIALGGLRASDFRVRPGAPRDAIDLIAVATADLPAS